LKVHFFTEEAPDGSLFYLARDLELFGCLAEGTDWLSCFVSFLEARALYLEVCLEEDSFE